MNFAMVSTNYRKMRRRISPTYAVSVAGAVLAISAVVAFRGHLDGTTTTPAAAKTLAPITWTYTDNSTATLRIFLVDSLVEALPQGVLIVAKGSAMDQDLFGASGGAAAAGTNIQIIERPFRLVGTAAQP